MAKIDRYLKPMAEGRADELHLYGNYSPTYLQDKQTVKKLERRFNNQELLEMLKEALGPDSVQELNQQQRLRTTYPSSFGVFLFQVRWSDGTLKARFTFSDSGGSRPPGQPSFSGDDFSSPPSAVYDSPSYSGSASGGYSPTTATFGAHPSTPSSSTHSRGGVQLQPHPSPIPDAPAGLVNPEDTKSTRELRIFRSLVREQRERPENKIDELFRLMVQNRASDLHLTSGEPPILRVDGKVKWMHNQEKQEPEQLAELLAPIMPQANLKEFIEKRDTDFAYEIEGLGRFRSNIFMDHRGIGAVFRIIPSKILTASDLGLPKAIRNLSTLSKGLVLVTGPTGSGKSTTLCAIIDQINSTRDEHIITIEDPIEFVHPNKRCLINQREVGVHTKSFKSALRAALREDPDIVLVGELRDQETAAIAIETAETGHLVFGTLHTSTAISTVDRLIDQFPGERQNQVRMMLSNSLKAVISQTLLRKRTGGRVAAQEILLVTSGVANLIREAKIHQIKSVMQTSRGIGMQTLNETLLELVKNNMVDAKEAYIKAIDKVEFGKLLTKNKISVKLDGID
jgi:twitching motility protein PilT